MGSILILVSLPYISPSSLEKDTLVIGEWEANAKIRLLAVSATYTLPDDGSTAMPVGDLSFLQSDYVPRHRIFPILI